MLVNMEATGGMSKGLAPSSHGKCQLPVHGDNEIAVHGDNEIAVLFWTANLSSIAQMSNAVYRALSEMSRQIERFNPEDAKKTRIKGGGILKKLFFFDNIMIRDPRIN